MIYFVAVHDDTEIQSDYILSLMIAFEDSILRIMGRYASEYQDKRKLTWTLPTLWTPTSKSTSGDVVKYHLGSIGFIEGVRVILHQSEAVSREIVGNIYLNLMNLIPLIDEDEYRLFAELHGTEKPNISH